MQRFLQRAWYDRPVRTQLLVAVGVINLIAALIAGAVSILNTRTATKVEIEASLDVAQRLVAATVRDLAAQGRLDELRDQLPVQLKHLRHVRIMFIDSMGHFTEVAPQDSQRLLFDEERAPEWYAELVRPRLVNRAVRVVTTDSMNPVVIVGEPADEIAEAWSDFSALVMIWLGLELLILVLLYIVLGRLLKPLANLSHGMANLESGDYATRLPLPKVRELAVITHSFNTLAGALDVAQEENSNLYRQLISVQESERREIANELHDEAGPCLFGITANASSLKRMQGPDEKSTHEISRRAGEILSIAERLKQLNRGLIKRLRPGPLGQVKLSDLLEELIASHQRSHPETDINANIGELAPSYGEQTDLTIYRCIQEGVTNAIRHGRAERIFIDLGEAQGKPNGSEPGAPLLRLSLRDNGEGMAPATPKGFGLTTMNERVRALEGTCEIVSSRSRGTRLLIEIPLKGEPEPKAKTSELVGGLS
ncbi:ATP-binding protein [Methyloligella solikamskensis]|uniref:ATP-binding protein n=1 Tax=Methyloligella solikamskensis TaxID=1177756 RepID=A0ABW3JBN9_9HYPH